MNSRSRITIALVTQIVAILFSLTTWTDPLEGGLAMVLAIGLSVVSWIIGRVTIPKFTWITAAASIAFLVLFWSLYIAELPADPASQDTYQPSETIWTLVSVYRVLSVVFICAIVFYAIAQFTARRALRAGDK